MFAAFSAPFWVAGAQLGKQALGSALQAERLELGRTRQPSPLKQWRLAARLPRLNSKQKTVDWDDHEQVLDSNQISSNWLEMI